MSERRYNHAPIISAMIDVQAGQSGTDDGAFFQQELEVPGYPTRQSIQGVEAQFTITPTPAGATVGTAATHTSAGVLYHSLDRKQFFRLTPQGFTFGRQNPYESWATFVAEARRVWDVCLPDLKYVGRLGLRYINRLDLPLPVRDFKDYLRTIPEISSDMPQELSGMFMRIQLPIEANEMQVFLTEAMIQPDRPDVVSIVLDIDVSSTTGRQSVSDDLWQRFEHFRSIKNEVFEACITDRMRELIR